MSAVIVPCSPVQLRRIAAGMFRYHVDRFRYCRRPRTGRLGRSRDEGTNTATFAPRGICLMSRRRCSDRSPLEFSLRPTPAPSIQRRSINPFTRNTLTDSVNSCTTGLHGMVSHPAPPQPGPADFHRRGPDRLDTLPSEDRGCAGGRDRSRRPRSRGDAPHWGTCTITRPCRWWPGSRSSVRCSISPAHHRPQLHRAIP